MQKGMHEGKEGLVLRQLRRRFGAIASHVMMQIDRLSPEQLDDLGEALLDFQAISDLDQWLGRHMQQGN